MANYNITGSNYLILNDQTGSTLTTTTNVSGSKYYTLIAPQYATGSTTIKISAFSGGGNNDILRIYDDVPSKYTASFNYNGTTVAGQLIGIISGASPSLPQTFTATSGKAYISWAPSSSFSTFTLQWTGSGFQTPDLTSSVSNKYALTFPKTSTPNGSYLTFAKGRFTGSAVTTNSDIIFGVWLKPNTFAQTPASEFYGIFTLGVSPDATHTPGITFYKPTNSQDLKITAIDSANTATTTLNMTSAMDGGGGSLATQYIPQWHHYGFVIKKPSSTSMVIRGYKDGQLFATGTTTTGLTAGGNFATTYDLVLGNYRGATGTIIESNNFSGSIDDAFLITIATGSTDAQLNSFFSDIYNSGSWKDPTLATGSLSSALNPKVQFAWRFEETGSALSTKDYGTYGNIHSASAQVTGAGNMTFTTTATGYSYTAYPSLSYALATPSNATIAFVSSSGSVYENTSSFTIGVRAVTASVAQSAIAAIQLSSSTNTASIGTDYNLIYGGTTYSSSAQLPIYITWSAGDTSTYYITASIFDNTTYNVNGSSSAFLKIEQGSSTNVTAGSPFLFELKILDYEPGYATLSSSSYSANESAGTASFRVGVNRISGSNGPLSVNYSTVDFTALSGTNYTKTTGTLAWTDGDSAIKYTSYIPILYDGVVPQNNPVFQIQLSGLSTGSFGVDAVTSSYVTIIDQEPGTFNWSVTSLTAYETGTLATVNVNRISGTYGAVTVNVSGSSSLGQVIRTTMTGALSFADGDTSKQFTINIQDDLLDESDDIIYYRLYPTSSTSGATAFTGSSGLLAFTLIDNETGSVTFNTGAASVYENTSSYIFNVQRLYGGDQAETASVSYTSTLTEGVGYNVVYNGVTKSSPFNVTWADQDKTTKYITASIYDNTVSSSSNTINFSIISSSISAIGPSSSFALTVLDYEEGYITFTSASYSTLESQPAVLYLDRISGSKGPLSVDFTTQNGTALSGTNYGGQSGTLTWSDGETSQKQIIVDIYFDNVQTSILNFKVNLSNLSTGSWSSYPSAITSSTVYITDQEPGTFRFTSSSYSVVEGQTLTVGLERYSGSSDTVFVNITSSNATAVSGTDYNAVNQSIFFNDGETLKTFTVTTLENSTNVSGSLYFNLGINSLSADYGNALAGIPYVTTINIIDNETGSIRFTSASYTGSQNSIITIPIERYIATGNPDFAATASIVVSSSSTAIAGVDYTNIFPYTVSWADQVVGTVNIQLSALGSWSASKILNLKIQDLTNIGSGSIMSSSILIQSNVITQSTPTLQNVGNDYVIYDYGNLSSQFTRRVQQVPFSLDKKGTGLLRKP